MAVPPISSYCVSNQTYHQSLTAMSVEFMFTGPCFCRVVYEFFKRIYTLSLSFQDGPYSGCKKSLILLEKVLSLLPLKKRSYCPLLVLNLLNKSCYSFLLINIF